MLQFAGYNMVTSGKKIKISLEYSGNVVNIECEQYKPIRSLKDKAGKIFYPLNSEIRLVYTNKDLTPYESVALGDFFKNKTNIHIKVFQIVNFNVKEQNVNYAYLSNSPNVNFKSFAGNVVNCGCGNDTVSYYCRTDKTFICKTCRLNKSHNNHIVNYFDVENIEESLKFYVKTLQSELNQCVKSCRKYTDNTKNSKLLDPQSRKEMIIRKLDEIEKRQQDFLKSLPESGNSSVLLEEVEDKASGCLNDLDNLKEKIHKIFIQDKSVGFNKTASFYNMISEAENEVNKINEIVVNYRVNFDVNRKFDDMFKMVEKALDSINNNDYNLDNLVDESTLAAYEKMISLKENKSLSKKQDDSKNSGGSEKGSPNPKLKKSLTSDYVYVEDGENNKKLTEKTKQDIKKKDSKDDKNPVEGKNTDSKDGKKIDNLQSQDTKKENNSNLDIKKTDNKDQKVNNQNKDEKTDNKDQKVSNQNKDEKTNQPDNKLDKTNSIKPVDKNSPEQTKGDPSNVKNQGENKKDDKGNVETKKGDSSSNKGVK